MQKVYPTSFLHSLMQYLRVLEAPATTSTYGILVVTGTNAPANTDYTIQTQTAHGASANQLQYQATSMGAAAIVGANVDTVVTRILVNASGGTITLKEIGMAVYNLAYYHLISHDTVNQAITNGEIAVVSIDIRTTI